VTVAGLDSFALSSKGETYAQLYRNSDDSCASPRIRITPPLFIVTTVDELAEVIAAEMAPYEVIPRLPKRSSRS
jgi:hypothetical protein